MILLTAAAISGVNPGAALRSASLSAASESSQSRNPPTVRWATGVVRVEDEAGDLVVLVGHDGLGEEGAQRDVRQGHLRRGTLCAAGGGNACEFVTGARRRGPREEGAEVVEDVPLAAKGVSEGHGVSRWPPWQRRP